MITYLDTAQRLAMAGLLGSLIGFERERLLWAAGIRTHMLVAIGSCLFMIVSAYGFADATKMPNVMLDPSRVAAQVVSGIGFLGAGSILLRGQVVRGLTTAASVWSVAAIGLAAGGGLYFAACLTTAIILATLAGIKPLEDAYRARVQSAVIEMLSERGAATVDEIKSTLDVRGGQVKRALTRPEGEMEHTTLHLIRVSQSDVQAGVGRLREVPGVQSVEVKVKRHMTN